MLTKIKVFKLWISWFALWFMATLTSENFTVDPRVLPWPLRFSGGHSIPIYSVIRPNGLNSCRLFFCFFLRKKKYYFEVIYLVPQKAISQPRCFSKCHHIFSDRHVIMHLYVPHQHIAIGYSSNENPYLHTMKGIYEYYMNWWAQMNDVNKRLPLLANVHLNYLFGQVLLIMNVFIYALIWVCTIYTTIWVI